MTAPGCSEKLLEEATTKCKQCLLAKEISVDGALVSLLHSV